MAGVVPVQGDLVLDDCRYFQLYINRHLFPQLFTDEELIHMTGYTLQQIYEWRDLFIEPFSRSPTVNNGDR